MMADSVPQLLDALQQEHATLARELTEIEMLSQQAASEVERHEARRAEAEQKLDALQRDPGATREALNAAHAQLLAQTRRVTVMQSQTEILAGKQRALERFRARITEALEVLQPLAEREAVAMQGPRAEPVAATAATGGDVLERPDSGEPSGGGSAAHATEMVGSSSRVAREVIAAQEEMRRDIARQMHDGPAQSIANIALQAQVVQRLFEREPQRAAMELGELVAMVQHALDATKTFIFDVRPMVLDDLGLVPTLRRAAAERSRRSGIDVDFQSVGSDRRLSGDLESGLFRIVDDAMVGYLERHPASVSVRLDWVEDGVRASVRAHSPDLQDTPDKQARAAVAAARRERQMPAALASMIREQERTIRHGLPDGVWSEIDRRAASVGIVVRLVDNGWSVEASALTVG
jgi:two-component system sensor histidine kinase DegS